MSGGSVYNVGIHLSAVNGVSGVLAAISKQMLGLHGSVHQLQKGFSSLNTVILGTVAAGVGVGIIKVGSHFEKAGEKLVHAEALLQAGLPKASAAMDMQIARTAAYSEAAKNLNSTLSGNVEHLHDLYNVVQDMGEAAHLLPAFNALQNAFSFAKGDTHGHGGNSTDLAYAARAFEITGRTTPEALDTMAKGYVRSVIGLRGRISGGDLFQALSSSGAARYGYSDEFIASGLPALMNVMKGRTGTALYHLGNNLAGGVASSWTQGSLQEKWGLHSADDEMRDPKTHRFNGFKVNSVFQADLLRSDPLEWGNKYREFLKAFKGVDIGDIHSMQKVVGEIARGNKSLGVALDELLLPNPNRQMNKERQNINNVSPEAVAQGEENDPGMWRQRLKAQWDNLEEAFGKTMVDPFINNVLKPLTNAFKDLSQLALAHPDAAKNIAAAAAGLAGALVVLGGAAVIAACAALVPGGVVAAGVLAIAGIVGALAALNWGALKEAWHSFDEASLKVFDSIKKVGADMITAIEAIPGQVAGAISSAFASIGSAIANAIKGLVSGAPHAATGDTGLSTNGGTGGMGSHLGGPKNPVQMPGKQGWNAPTRGTHVTIHNYATLDGEVVHRSVTRRMVASIDHATHAASSNRYGHGFEPGANAYG